MTAWWESLDLLERVLACIAVPATLLLVLQLALSLLGLGGHEGDLEAEAGGDLDAEDFDADDPGAGIAGHDGFALRMLSLRGILAFLSVYGWAALAVSRAGHPWLAAILVGLILGAAAMVLVAAAMGLILALQTDGTVDRRNAVGLSGTVYLTVPAQRQGSGKVNVVIQEKLTECDAVTDEMQPLPTGTPVTVVGLTREQALIVMRGGGKE